MTTFSLPEVIMWCSYARTNVCQAWQHSITKLVNKLWQTILSVLVADLNVLQRFNYIFQTNLYLIHISIYRKIDDSDQAITAYIHEMEDTRPRQRQTNKVERNLRELRVKKKKKMERKSQEQIQNWEKMYLQRSNLWWYWAWFPSNWKKNCSAIPNYQ